MVGTFVSTIILSLHRKFIQKKFEKAQTVDEMENNLYNKIN